MEQGQPVMHQGVFFRQPRTEGKNLGGCIGPFPKHLCLYFVFCVDANKRPLRTSEHLGELDSDYGDLEGCAGYFPEFLYHEIN